MGSTASHSRCSPRRAIAAAALAFGLGVAALLLGPSVASAQQAVNSFTGVTIFPEGSAVRSHVRVRRLDEIQVIFVPTTIAYGISTNLTLAATVPYFRKERESLDPGGQLVSRAAAGFGDIVLAAKYRFLNLNGYRKTLQLAALGGVKLPTGATDAASGGQLLPIPLQPGSGSVDWLAAVGATGIDNWRVVHVSVLYKRNTQGARDFHFGDVFNYNLALLARVLHVKYPGPELYLGLELNGEVLGRSQVAGADVTDSGGHRMFLSPDFVFFLFRNLTLEGSVQVPVLQDLNGTQPDESVRFVLGFRLQYGLYF